MGAIMASQLATPPTTESFIAGFERALRVAAGIALVGAVVAAMADPAARPAARGRARLHRAAEAA